MPIFKNTSGHPIEVPALDLRIPDGGTFEVPDEVAASFDVNPDFTKSRTTSPDQAVDPAAVGPLTGTVPADPAAAPAPYTPPTV